MGVKLVLSCIVLDIVVGHEAFMRHSGPWSSGRGIALHFAWLHVCNWSVSSRLFGSGVWGFIVLRFIITGCVQQAGTVGYRGRDIEVAPMCGGMVDFRCGGDVVGIFHRQNGCIIVPIAPKYKVVDGVVVIELLGGGPMVFQRLFALPCPGQCRGKLLPGCYVRVECSAQLERRGCDQGA